MVVCYYVTIEHLKDNIRFRREKVCKAVKLRQNWVLQWRKSHTDVLKWLAEE